MPSFTPPREPGRFTTKLRPAIPATPRLSRAVAFADSPRRRTASRIPGISRSISGAVCSGVTSVGLMPVPPEVMTTSTPSATASASARPTSGPSATTCFSTGVRPRPHSHRSSRGPVRSS